ncbi:hypothetical protein D3C75_1294150 [compost metagenome]
MLGREPKGSEATADAAGQLAESLAAFAEAGVDATGTVVEMRGGAPGSASATWEAEHQG